MGLTLLIPDDRRSSRATVRPSPALATAVAVTAVVLCSAYLRSWRVLVVQVAAVGLTMLGRVVLGEHYVADVVGAAAGIAGIGLLAAVGLGLMPARDGAGEPGVGVEGQLMQHCQGA